VNNHRRIIYRLAARDEPFTGEGHVSRERQRCREMTEWEAKTRTRAVDTMAASTALTAESWLG